jgi:hypothetical protein
MSMSEMTLRGNPELGRVIISMLEMELSEAVSSIQPRAHKRVKGNGFRGNMGENIKRVSRNGIREVRDDSNAVPSIRSFI